MKFFMFLAILLLDSGLVWSQSIGDTLTFDRRMTEGQFLVSENRQWALAITRANLWLAGHLTKDGEYYFETTRIEKRPVPCLALFGRKGRAWYSYCSLLTDRNAEGSFYGILRIPNPNDYEHFITNYDWSAKCYLAFERIEPGVLGLRTGTADHFRVWRIAGFNKPQTSFFRLDNDGVLRYYTAEGQPSGWQAPKTAPGSPGFKEWEGAYWPVKPAGLETIPFPETLPMACRLPLDPPEGWSTVRAPFVQESDEEDDQHPAPEHATPAPAAVAWPSRIKPNQRMYENMFLLSPNHHWALAFGWPKETGRNAIYRVYYLGNSRCDVVNANAEWFRRPNQYRRERLCLFGWTENGWRYTGHCIEHNEYPAWDENHIRYTHQYLQVEQGRIEDWSYCKEDGPYWAFRSWADEGHAVQRELGVCNDGCIRVLDPGSDSHDHYQFPGKPLSEQGWKPSEEFAPPDLLRGFRGE